ncbi:Diacylglycerol pyrophosphate phosphatase 1 [Wickerhamiella sorbophila]|uniref:Diacylglycerol pyrophosphate phosphatase 1 n=1 Tax=Wickerhamiella sorbophila TaxID=45607 RepID=A0A2T0FGI6_9ASCO|nr:Diacylglycerol pyrophosphate phosphatase 1 [Wickerhamiella sorbophila]PRT54077.1 Diacylglycerol pyrophosphate phosphatase 1 [Wickerhamiella sorbophila]
MLTSGLSQDEGQNGRKHCNLPVHTLKVASLIRGMFSVFDMFNDLKDVILLIKGNFLLDALTIGGLGVLCVPVEFILKGNHRLFRLDDPSIQFPMTEHERVPNLALVVIAGILPMVAIVLLSWRRKHTVQHILIAVMAFVMAMVVNLFITGLVKLWIGNTRPDLISRCMPATGTPLHEYVSVEVCTNTKKSVLSDGFRSTPSGHSSNSFCGLGFLSLWTSGQFGLWRSGASVYKILIGGFPLVVALYVAVSRIADYRHHWFDVLLGSCFGFTVAYFTYFHYYPSVQSPQSYVPLAVIESNESDDVV